MPSLRLFLTLLGLACVATAQVPVTVSNPQTTVTTTNLNSFTLSNQLKTRTETLAIGQVFNTPGIGTYFLNSFSVDIKDTILATSFNAYLQEWDSNAPVGGPLWTSPSPISLSQSLLNPSYRTYTLEVGSLLLDSTKSYVAYLTVDNLRTLSFASSGDTYSGGSFVTETFTQNRTIKSTIFGIPIFNSWDAGSTAWNTVQGTDMAFTAKFTAVPEPSTYALGGAGSLLVLAALRRRKKAV